NRDQAWKMLRARLYEVELEKREEAQQALNDQKTDIGWGHQIRSYVLQPYQMVKDLRTDVETSDTAGVLDGDLDQFMAAALAQRVGATRDGAEGEGGVRITSLLASAARRPPVPAEGAWWGRGDGGIGGSPRRPRRRS